jgi:heptosyltransferase-2
MQKILVIQTAFIGDVILATAVLEQLHQLVPDAAVDVLVRQGNESLFHEHPFLHKVLVWNKKQRKYAHLYKLLKTIRREKYDLVVNLQRYSASAVLTAFSGAHQRVGFDSNPLSALYTYRKPHRLEESGDAHWQHEVNRCLSLIDFLVESPNALPKLYPTAVDVSRIQAYVSREFITISPASVWFTKQYPEAQWIKFLQLIPEQYAVYLLGAPSDAATCNNILVGAGRANASSLAGQLNFLQSAAIMQSAVMNYVNDSAPMHFASSVNAPVTAIYCSTLPVFGYGPLSDNRHIVEVQKPLNCRPCGIHGRKACPQGHFNCANLIAQADLLAVLP